MFKGKGKLLRIFIGEEAKYEKIPLYEWIIRKARKDGIAGATVIKGFEGFGADNKMHTTKILRLAQDLPIIVEVIDCEEKIRDFVSSIDPVIKEGLATLEDIEIHFYDDEKEKT